MIFFIVLGMFDLLGYQFSFLPFTVSNTYITSFTNSSIYSSLVLHRRTQIEVLVKGTKHIFISIWVTTIDGKCEGGCEQTPEKKEVKNSHIQINKTSTSTVIDTVR